MTQPSSRWACAGANVIGRSHELNHGRCEDRWSRYRRNSGGVHGEVIAACVSDGAGSVSFGYIGASVVSSTLTKWLVDKFPLAVSASTDEIKSMLMPYLLSKLRQIASRKQTTLRNFASTIVAVAVAEDGSGMALHLGDGGIIGRFGAELRQVSVPMKGEFANETFFVSDRDATDRMRILRWGPCEACDSGADFEPANGFLLFSDGLETSLLQRTTQAIAPAASTMLTWLENYPEPEVTTAVQSNLHDVFRLRTMDDCTLVLMSNVSCSMISLSDEHPAQLPQATSVNEWIGEEPPADLSWFS